MGTRGFQEEARGQATGVLADQRLHDSPQVTILYSLRRAHRPSSVLKIVENLWVIWAPPRTTLRELTALSRHPSWCRGDLLPLPTNYRIWRAHSATPDSLAGREGTYWPLSTSYGIWGSSQRYPRHPSWWIGDLLALPTSYGVWGSSHRYPRLCSWWGGPESLLSRTPPLL